MLGDLEIDNTATKNVNKIILFPHQEEHWVKVHRQHCKFLSGRRIADGTTHHPSTCEFCQEDSEEVRKPNNAKYGCHYSFFSPPEEIGRYCPVMDSAPVSFEASGLGKQTRYLRQMGVEVMLKNGDWVCVPTPFSWFLSSPKSSRIERTVLVMQKVLFKMHLTKHRITLKYPEEMDRLRKVLSMIQGNCWRAAIHYPREAWSGRSLHLLYEVQLENISTTEVSKIFGKIGGDKKIPSYRDPFDLWAILQLLAGFLYNRVDILMKAMQKIPYESYPKPAKGFMKYLDVDGQYSIWDQILDALGDHLVPYSHLVEIFCMGKTRRSCGSCKRDTTVELVKQIGESLELKSFISGLGALVTDQGTLVSCHRKACFKKISKLFDRIEHLLVEAFLEKQNASFKCDHCFFLCEKVHRCTRCWTKVFCSQECFDKDKEKVHEKICRSGEEPRKVKADKKTRFAERDQTLETWHQHKENVDKKNATGKSGTKKNGTKSKKM